MVKRSFEKSLEKKFRHGRTGRKNATLRDVRVDDVCRRCKMRSRMDSELENSESKVGGCCIRSSVGEKSSNGRLGGENDDY